jgi:hypothetical protein
VGLWGWVWDGGGGGGGASALKFDPFCSLRVYDCNVWFLETAEYESYNNIHGRR